MRFKRFYYYRYFSQILGLDLISKLFSVPYKLLCPTVLSSPMKLKLRIKASLFLEEVLKLLIVVKVVIWMFIFCDLVTGGLISTVFLKTSNDVRYY